MRLILFTYKYVHRCICWNAYKHVFVCIIPWYANPSLRDKCQPSFNHECLYCYEIDICSLLTILTPRNCKGKRIENKCLDLYSRWFLCILRCILRCVRRWENLCYRNGREHLICYIGKCISDHTIWVVNDNIAVLRRSDSLSLAPNTLFTEKYKLPFL